MNALTSPILPSSLYALTLEPRGYLPLVARMESLPYGLKGLAGSDHPSHIFDEHYDVYHNWTVAPLQMDSRFARTVKCITEYHMLDYDYGSIEGLGYQSQITAAAQADTSNNIHGRVWLIFNEPDNTYSHPQDPYNTDYWQCGRFPLTGNPEDPNNYAPQIAYDPATVAILYGEVYDLIKTNDPSAKVFVGGFLGIHTTGTRSWWTTFLSTLESRDELYKVEGVHVHSYPEWSTGSACEDYPYCAEEMARELNEWYNDYHIGMGLGALPIWITETGAGGVCKRWTKWNQNGWTAVRDHVMMPMSWWFEGNVAWQTDHGDVPTNRDLAFGGYESILWYIPWCSEDDGTCQEDWWCTFLVDSRNSPVTLTNPLGYYWYNYNPEP